MGISWLLGATPQDALTIAAALLATVLMIVWRKHLGRERWIVTTLALVLIAVVVIKRIARGVLISPGDSGAALALAHNDYATQLFVIAIIQALVGFALFLVGTYLMKRSYPGMKQRVAFCDVVSDILLIAGYAAAYAAVVNYNLTLSYRNGLGEKLTLPIVAHLLYLVLPAIVIVVAFMRIRKLRHERQATS
jgi:hypothetical protein